MKKLLCLSTALCVTVGMARAEVVVMSWGGSYGAAQSEAHLKPFTAETGIKTTMLDSDNPATPVKAMVEAGNVTVDIASLEYADGVRLCDEGLLETVDESWLAAGDDGTPAVDDFLPGALTECLVGTDVWTTIFAYDSSKLATGPTLISDFFDLEKFPGKRGMRKGAKTNLEMALMADGVAPADVYETLGTEEGVARAFAKLDSIKSEVVWWEAGAQPPQLLGDGEVVMTTAYNGRIFNAAIDEAKPFTIVWDGQVYEYEGYVIPKGAPNLEDAKKFMAFATDTKRLAEMNRFISYGPTRHSTASINTLYKDGTTEMAPHLPTNPANMAKAIETSFEFWVDHDTQLNEQFNAWLLAN